MTGPRPYVLLALAAFSATFSTAALGQQISFDDFNRANSTNLGANWSEVNGDFVIDTNQTVEAVLKAAKLLKHPFVAVLFLVFSGVTGFLVAFSEFFGEEEALREATRDQVSPVTTASPDSVVAEAVAKSLATAARLAGSSKCADCGRMTIGALG